MRVLSRRPSPRRDRHLGHDARRQTRRRLQLEHRCRARGRPGGARCRRRCRACARRGRRGVWALVEIAVTMVEEIAEHGVRLRCAGVRRVRPSDS